LSGFLLAVSSVFPKSSPDEGVGGVGEVGGVGGFGGVGGVGGVGEECFEVEEFQIYRQAELNRTTASLLANGAILIVGEEGSGKSVLGNAVVERLTDDGFLVAFVEPTTPKQMLLEITQQFELPTEDIEGKNLTVDKLKRAICLQQRFAIAT